MRGFHSVGGIAKCRAVRGKSGWSADLFDPNALPSQFFVARTIITQREVKLNASLSTADNSALATTHRLPPYMTLIYTFPSLLF
jgi:hypothetical protein